jgi:hypothetical protein
MRAASQSPVAYRTLEFKLSERISDVNQQLREMHGLKNSESCHYGLYLVAASKNGLGTWLDENRVLQDYHPAITAPQGIEFRNVLRSLRVTDLDGGLRKTVLINPTWSLRQLVMDLCLRFGVTAPEEYSLQVKRDQSLVWVDETASLDSQLKPEKDVILRKKFVLNKLLREDHTALHFTWLEARQSVITGAHPISMQQALTLASLQMQITYANYDPLVHVAGFLKLSEVLPPQFRKVGFIEEDVYTHHRHLKDVSELEAKYRYVKKLMIFPTYGVTTFRAKDPTEIGRKDVLIGVGCSDVVVLHPDTKDILSKHSIHALDFKIDGSSKLFTWRIEGKERQLEIENVDDIRILVDLINGYRVLTKNQKNQKDQENVSSSSKKKPLAPVSGSQASPDRAVSLSGTSPTSPSPRPFTSCFTSSCITLNVHTSWR